MASFLDVANILSDVLVAAIAPYQPNTLAFPNTAPTAGVIPSTVVGPGYPLQYWTTTALEQGQAVIGIHDTKIEKPNPVLSTALVAVTDPNTHITTYYRQVARTVKQFQIEIWAYTPEARDALQQRVRASLSDAYRINQSDGTVTLIRYVTSDNVDTDQMDSLWICQMRFSADITTTEVVAVGTSDAGEGYPVTETQTVLQPEDVLGDPAGPPLEIDYP
jgi:hypothetical protein